ncbi:MAG TPA: DUF2254 domain-containing protein, partial [Beijerinckiaceae bacterium]|nr:DUF2254 domain-containing protein [Beijerinckiaceae bacterium]
MRRRGHPSERVRATWDHVRTSLWFVPAVMTLIGGGGLTAAGLALDAALGTDTAVPGWVYVASPDDARTILTTLLQSMMTMTSLVFSITMVVLTLAARQFGPRLVRNFMGSLATQVVLGTFVTTIVYCLLVLSAVGWRGQEGLFPYASVTIAIALSLVSVGMLVFFIHALSRSLFAEVVIERVGRELDGAQAELRPLAPEDGEDPEQVLPADFADRARYFGPTIAGYVQAIEFERLVAIAAENDLFLGFHFRAGDYVAADGRGIGAYPGERIRPDLIEAINGAVVVGTQRTLVQDLEFPIRHLVEIVVRDPGDRLG